MGFIYLQSPVEAKPADRFGWRFDPAMGTSTFHDGIDFPVPVGTQVRATAAGRVVAARERGSAGLTVVIQHAPRIFTLYAHNRALQVREGQEVKRGQVIALSGMTGRAMGPHLHFSLNVNGAYVDPIEAMRLGIDSETGELNSLTFEKEIAKQSILFLLLVAAHFIGKGK